MFGGTRRAEHDRDEAHAVAIEDLYDPREVHQRAAQPVHLVDRDTVHRPGLDGCQQPLQRRPVHIADGVAAVVEGLGDHLPALLFLARDVGLGGFALGVEGVELLLEPLVGGLARVDRAADQLLQFRCRAGGGAVEEKEAVPLRARDLSGDRAERTVHAAFKLEADGQNLYDHSLALVLALEVRAGRRQPGIVLARHFACDAAARVHVRVSAEQVPWRADPQVGVVGDLQGSATGALGQPAPRVGLDAPGDAAKQELLLLVLLALSGRKRAGTRRPLL